MNRIVAALALVALAGLAAVFLAVFLLQRSLVFPRPEGRIEPSQAGLPDVVSTRFAASDGTPIELWRTKALEGPVVILFHGNGQINGWNGARIDMAERAGFAIAAMEYRGYAGNPGEPSEAALVADAEALVRHLGREGVAPDRIVVWGYSIGAAVAIQLAARQPFRAVILEAPFLSLVELVSERYAGFPVRPFLRDSFASDVAAPLIGSPTLVLAGAGDELIPQAHGRAIAGLIEGARFVGVPDAGHADIPDSTVGGEAIRAFLAKHR